MSDHGHEYVARGPFCYAWGDTAREAVENLKKNWPNPGGHLKVPEYGPEHVDVILRVPRDDWRIAELNGTIEYGLETDAKNCDRCGTVHHLCSRCGAVGWWEPGHDCAEEPVET